MAAGCLEFHCDGARHQLLLPRGDVFAVEPDVLIGGAHRNEPSSTNSHVGSAFVQDCHGEGRNVQQPCARGFHQGLQEGCELRFVLHGCPEFLGLFVADLAVQQRYALFPGQ